MLEARYRDVFPASLPQRVLIVREVRHGEVRRVSGHKEVYKK